MTAPTPEGPSLTVHGVQAGGQLTESLGTARVLTTDAVGVSLTNLPLPLVVVAPPEALVRPSAGSPTPGGRRLEVVTVHIGGTASSIDGPESTNVALEFDEPVLVMPPPDPTEPKPARSVLCLIFPRLQACRPRD